MTKPRQLALAGGSACLAGRHPDWTFAPGAAGLRWSLLVQLGHLKEARRYGLKQLTQAHDALVLAQVLLEHGATQDALEIAEHNLSLNGELWTLASWWRDEARRCGRC